jgi:hypothetical protein
MAGFNLEVSKSATHHVRTTLPPTMHQNLEAGIRYFVKATVNVPSMFKENPRAVGFPISFRLNSSKYNILVDAVL